jgi:cytidylate kinase
MGDRFTIGMPLPSSLLSRLVITLVITIDGPSGAGKSSSAAALAGRLSLRCLNSGSLYRAVAWKVLAAKLDPQRQSDVEAFCRTLRIRLSDDGIWVDDLEATPYLRLPDVTQASSSISAFSGVRQALIEVQRDFAKQGGLVAEGRDMGTVVFPHADVKFYMDADPQVRSLRQYAALPVQTVDLNTHGDQVRKRDSRDRQREVAPLKAAEDAILIDSTQMTPEAVVARMLSDIERVLAAR